MADYNIELINDTEYTIKLNEQGPQGATGPRGPQGEQGLQGVKGDKGDVATIEVGDTETLPAKTNAYVMNTGTINDAVLEFGIPKGYSPTIEEDVNTEAEYRLKIVNEDSEFITPNLRSQAYIPYATQEEAIAGTREDLVISPATAKDVAYNYIGKITQLGFNGVLESGVVTFTPDVDTPYDIKEGYEYEIDLLFPAAGVLPDATKLVIENNGETINLVNVKHSDSTQAIEYGDMKQVCRYDNEIGWRWIFNARFAITDAGNKVFVIPSTVTDTPSNVVTTDTNQNITGAKNFINSATSTTPDAHTGMSLTLKNDQAELGGDSTNSDGTVNFKYQGVRFVDKNNEEVASLYSAPDGVGGSFTRLNASAKVDGEYVDGFVELEVDANGKTHFYVPEVDEDSTVNGTQAATVDYVKAHAGGLEIGTIVTMPFGVDESENKYRYLNGQVLIQSQFSAFTTKVKSWQTTRPGLFTTEDNWQAEKTASEFGIVDKFVIDDEAGTIRLPKYPEYIVAGADKVKGNGINIGVFDANNTHAGMTLEAQVGVSAYQNYYGTEVLNNKTSGSGVLSAGAMGLTTDSSKSGMVTNQEVVKCYYVIVVNTGVEEAERPINNYQVNNVYSYGMSTYYRGTMNNNSWLRSAGQWNPGTRYNGVYEWAASKLNEKVYDPSKFTIVGSPTITSDGIASGFSGSNYLKTPTINFSNASSWEINFKFTTPVDSSTLNYGRNILGREQFLRVVFDPNKTIRFLVKGANITWGDHSSVKTIDLGTTYYGKLYFTGSAYKLDLSIDGSVYENYITYNNSNTAYDTFLGIGYHLSGGDSYSWQGSIDLKSFSITVDGEEVFSGSKIAQADGFKKSTDSDITDYDWVLNTEEQTFRLPVLAERILVESKVNGTQGYNLYSDGWCEQWGISQISGRGVTVQLLKQFANTDFSVLLTCGSNTTGWPVAWTSNSGKTTSSFYFDGTGNCTGADRNIQVNWKVSGYAAISTSSPYNLYYYIGDVLENADLINIARMQEELVDIKSTPHIVETYQNGNSWYRLWSDSWIEQGGTLEISGTRYINQSILFLKTMANNSYTVSLTSRLADSGSNFVGGGAMFNNKTTTSVTVNAGIYENSSVLTGCCWRIEGYAL